MREELAAAYVGLSVTGLRAKVDAGEIAAPKRHSAGRIIYLRDNLDAYLDQLFQTGGVSGAPEIDPEAEWDAFCGLGETELPGSLSRPRANGRVLPPRRRAPAPA